jgi:hypothetical protein
LSIVLAQKKATYAMLQQLTRDLGNEIKELKSMANPAYLGA